MTIKDSVDTALVRLDERITAHKELVAEQFDQRDRALLAAKEALDKEIVHLNELRREVTTDREQFARKDAVESQAASVKEALDKSEERLRVTITQITDRLVRIEGEAKAKAAQEVEQVKAGAFADNVKVAIVAVMAAGGGAVVTKLLLG